MKTWGRSARLEAAGVLTILATWTADAAAHDCPPLGGAHQFGTALFDRVDADHDGVVRLPELLQAELERFYVFDRDRNQVVDRAEAKAGGRVWREQRFERRFRELDKNGDGVLTPEEGALDRPGFVALDRNRDGRITREELRQTFLRGHADRAPRSDGAFERWDLNRDGVVTPQELTLATEQRFTGWDSDRDGGLNRHEMQAGAADSRRNLRHPRRR